MIHMLIRSTVWLGLSVFLLSSLSLTLSAESQAPLKNLLKPKIISNNFSEMTARIKEWRVIDGFRSAKFGMSEKEVLRAIAKDFKISKSKVNRKVLPSKHTALIIHTSKLMKFGGPADIVYFLDPKSKGLIRINIDWGKEVADNVDSKDILSAANLLRKYFVKKRYKTQLYAVNAKINDTSMIIFRGYDEKGRSILLRLNSPMSNKGLDEEEGGKHMSLVLTYAEKE